MRRSPAVTAAALLALALGIGANTAMFSVVDGVLLRPLPYPDSGALLAVYRTSSHTGMTRGPFSYPDFKDLQAQSRVFEKVGAWANGDANLSGGGTSERVLLRVASPSLLPTLRVVPIAGRAFLPGETFKGSDHVVLLDYALAKRRFGSAHEAVGRQVRLDGVNYQVVGVLPRGFALEGPADVWLPLSTSLDILKERNAHMLKVVARRRPNATPERIATDLATFSAGLSKAHPDIYPSSLGLGATSVPLLHQVVGGVSRPLLVLLVAVAFVLLIACVNVANLLLARAAARHHEMAIRTALGAGRGRLVRQLLTESVVLAVIGAALGLVLASWAIDGLVALAPSALPRIGNVAVDARVLGVTAVIAVATGIAFGLAPALSASDPVLHDALKDATRGSSSGRGRLRRALVVAEVALSVVLLIGTGLMLRSFLRLRDVDPGFRPDHAVTLSVSLPVPGNRFTDADHARFVRFFGDADARLARLPGVSAAGAVSIMPLSGRANDRWFDLEGFTAPTEADHPDAEWREVDGNWLGAMGIPIVRGRGFLPSDGPTAPRVAIVNQEWVRHFSPGRDPLGRHIRLSPSSQSPHPEWATIIGVVGDVRGYGLDAPTRPEMYWPLPQSRSSSFMSLVVRGRGDPAQLIDAARKALAEVDPSQPLFNVQPLDHLLSASLTQRRFTLTLMLLFGIAALALAAVGIYGVMAYTVAQQAREIGIRLALGASPSRVLGEVLRDGMIPVAVGLVLGGAGALALARVAASLLWGVSTADAGTYVAVSMVLATVAFVAISIPARRATRVDPMSVLRSE